MDVINENDKPKLKMVGEDGNAFSIMGRASKAARNHGWNKEQINEFLTECTSGNYDNILQLCMKHFDVDVPDENEDF